jgi:uncharacterized protein YjiS (DUF1127 family)
MPQSSSIQTHRRSDSSAVPRRSVIACWIHSVGTWFSRRRAYLELCSLDDHLLNDVGIPREVVRQLGKPPWWP